MGSALTRLKFHEFATKPDAVALLPTSHDCEDEEYVDGSAISPATVLFQRSHIEPECPYIAFFPDSSRPKLWSTE